MFTTYSDAGEEFEKLFESMSPADTKETVGVGTYRVVHGLVVMDVYLLGHPQYERHRSELMAEFGSAWFTVRADHLWREKSTRSARKHRCSARFWRSEN